MVVTLSVFVGAWRARHQSTAELEAHGPPAHQLPTPYLIPLLNKTSHAMSSGASAGDGGVPGEPQPKKRRADNDRDGKEKFQHDGPVEDEETAREKMEEAGFDPDDVTKQCVLSKAARKAFNTRAEKLRPITYFCRVGDLKMCRYLLSKGASTTATSTDGFWFPMYTAALGGHLDVCKWLYAHGAEEDMGGRNTSGYTPLGCATSQACCRWFILKGVLSLDDKPGVVCPRLMRRDIGTRVSDGLLRDVRPQLLKWAQQSVQTHSSFMTFLLGTFPSAVPTFSRAALRTLLVERLLSKDAAEMVMKNTPDNEYERLWSSLWSKIIKRTTPVCYLGEKTGILELIADYAGVIRGRDLRILRSLVDPLSEYLEEVPFRPERGRGGRDRGVRGVLEGLDDVAR